MLDKHNTASTDLVEQVMKVFVENLRDRGWRLVRELEALIPGVLADVQCDKEDPQTTADLKTPKDRQEFGRRQLRIYALQALVASGRCEVLGDNGKQEARLVAQDGAAEAAVPPASTTPNQSDVNASQATTQRNTQNSSENIDVLTGNRMSATLKGTTDVDQAVAVNVPVETNNANPITEQVDDKMSNSGVAEMPFHPVADLFPLSTGAEYEELKNDIKANGLLVPIWTYKGQIIDGRNRYRACLELGIEPRFQEWDGRGSLVAFVISLNARRRHLSTSQRALVAAKAKPMFEEEARQRQLAGKPADLPPKLEEGRQGEAAAQAAEQMGVSPSAVYQGQTVLREGSPELQHAVETGQVNVSTAAALTSLDQDEQAQVAKQGQKAARAKAKEVAQRKKTTRKAANNAGVQPSGTKAKDDVVKKKAADQAEGFKRLRQALDEAEAAWKLDQGGFASEARKLKGKNRDRLKSLLRDNTGREKKLLKALDA